VSAAFTPGPWYRYMRQSRTVCADVGNCLERIAGVRSQPNAEANLSLILAAPELYEALYNIIDINDEADTCMGGLADCRDGGNGPVQSRELQVVIELSRAALARARGEHD
jgi:hypothetical protein